jgi:hypothetical protein
MRVLLGVLFFLAGCGAAARAPSARTFEGEVLSVHMLGQHHEAVTICHFDPRYVVTVRTANGTERLAVHSPVLEFGGEPPIGARYRFRLEQHDQRWVLDRPERLDVP